VRLSDQAPNPNQGIIGNSIEGVSNMEMPNELNTAAPIRRKAGRPKKVTPSLITAPVIAPKAAPSVSISNSKLLRPVEVCATLSISRATLFRFMKREDFPQPIRMTARVIAWHASAIDGWLATRSGNSIAA
jgi:prophage regulatory protein